MPPPPHVCLTFEMENKNVFPKRTRQKAERLYAYLSHIIIADGVINLKHKNDIIDLQLLNVADLMNQQYKHFHHTLQTYTHKKSKWALVTPSSLCI